MLIDKVKQIVFSYCDFLRTGTNVALFTYRLILHVLDTMQYDVDDIVDISTD